MRYHIIIAAHVFMLASASIVSGSEARLKQMIRLHGLPKDEVPVVTAVAIQPHGHLLATAGDDHTIRLWDIDSGRLVKELRGHQDWVTAVSFCSDGAELISGSRDRQVFVWDVATGRRTGNLGVHQHPVSTIIVSERQDRVAISGFRAPLKVYDLASGKLLGSLRCPCTDTRAVAFSPDMNFLAAGGRSGKIRIWHLAKGTKTDINAHRRRVWSVVFTSDNRLISAGEDMTIKVWDSTTGKQTHRISSESGKVLSMTMIGDQQFAAASADNVIRLFDLSTSRPHSVLEGHTGSIAALDFRDDTLISGSFDTTVRVWSILDAQPTTHLTPSSGVVPIASN